MDHIFSTYAKFSEKLTSTYVCVSRGKKCQFSENFAYTLNGSSQTKGFQGLSHGKSWKHDVFAGSCMSRKVFYFGQNWKS